MSVYSITYRDGHKVAVPVNKEEYLAIRGSSKNIANLQMARKGSDLAKRSLAQFNYSCYPNEDGTLKGADKPSKTVAMDIDHVEDPRTTATPIIKSAKENGVYMIERTAGGKGLHVVFKRNPQLNNEENIKAMAEKLGVDADLQAKDITRVLFATTASSQELYYLDDEIFADNGANVSQGSTATSKTSSQTIKGDDTSQVTDDYMGIPYSKIVDAWWKVHYGGQTPTKHNRNTQTYEMAVNFRHICGYSEAQLQHVIPQYDGFPEDEWKQTISNAINARRTLMPRKMNEVLTYVRQYNVTDVETQMQLEDQLSEDDRMYEKALPKLPIGLAESVQQSGKGQSFPAIFAIASLAGFYATKVKLAVHENPKGLNVQAFIVGESGSGKGQITRIVEAWTRHTQSRIDAYYEKEAEWAKKAQAKQSGTREQAPDGKVRIIAINNTSANVCERLEAVKGKHSFSYASEADVIYGKWKGDMESLTTMLRNAWDNDRYDREAKSAEAARCHIPHMMWNTVLCGTPDALYRLITNVTDGFMNRICIARTPDNTFLPYEVGSERGFSEDDNETIDYVVDCLKLMEGRFEDETLEQWVLEWTETMRIESIKMGMDRVYARMRMRTPISSARAMVASYILPKAVEMMTTELGSRKEVIRTLTDNGEAWMQYAHKAMDEDAHQFYQTVSDYMVDNYLYYFGEELYEAYANNKYNRNTSANIVSKRKKKDNLFDALPDEFTLDELQQVVVDIKGKTYTRGNLTTMCSRWKTQGLIEDGGRRGEYKKINGQSNTQDDGEQDM